MDPRHQMLNTVLQYGAEALDVSPEVEHRLAYAYGDLAQWIKAENEQSDRVDSEIYAQGSRRLGTLTAPVDPNADCDIDLVYERKMLRESTTQQQLKDHVGDQLQRYAADARLRGLDLLECTEKSRCWTLHFREFHLDVLPALPNTDHPHARVNGGGPIVIPDRELFRWQSSYPKGFAAWFWNRMAVALLTTRQDMAKSANVDIEKIPEHTVKTPLQRAVQLLKRHRDMWFEGPADDKPISIIITTLAALAYENQRDVLSALRDIARRMPELIEHRDGRPWVPNPVDPRENFADKWSAHPARADYFRRWLSQVEADLGAASRADGLDEVANVLSKGWGAPVQTAVRRFGAGVSRSAQAGQLRFSPSTGVVGSTGAIAIPRHTFFGGGHGE